jgi:hypothetical protein
MTDKAFFGVKTPRCLIGHRRQYFAVPPVQRGVQFHLNRKLTDAANEKDVGCTALILANNGRTSFIWCYGNAGDPGTDINPTWTPDSVERGAK